MSYARFVTRRFRQRGESPQDLEQVAYLGLVKAVDNFDPDYGTTFLTYATPIITGEIKRHFRDTTWDLHVPRRMQELSATVRAAQEELTQRMGTSPSAGTWRSSRPAAGRGRGRLRGRRRLPHGVAGRPGGAARRRRRHPRRPARDDDPGIDLVVDREALKPLLERLTGGRSGSC